MIKIGVLGAGHLGKIHIKLLKEIGQFELVGFHDLNEETARKVEQEFGIARFSNVNDLLEKVDALDIVSPTTTHFYLAAKAVQQNKHVFIEKPLTHTLAEAQELLHLVNQFKVKAQVGHVERFNPAFLSIQHQNLNPLFIETHRLAQFNPRGTDVPVVLDLMIHDLDIILSIVDAEVKSVQASGVAIISDSPDIANARIEFENGCVANVTASRLSLKNMRKMRIFQRDAYISVDFLSKNSKIVQLSEEKPNHSQFMELNTGKEQTKKFVTFFTPEVQTVNAIRMELSFFAESILHDTDVEVSVEDGYKAMKLAHQILAAMETS